MINHKVLVIEDCILLQNLFMVALQEIVPNDIIMAANGKEALDIVEKEANIGVVISDWEMPIMDGMEFLKEFRQKNNRMPVIMCSARSTQQDIDFAKAIGADEYIVKPFNIAELKTKVECLLQNY